MAYTRGVQRAIAVELDPAADAALRVLMAQGRTVSEAVCWALVEIAGRTTNMPVPGEASDGQDDSVIGLA
jgi:hypothetical protein